MVSLHHIPHARMIIHVLPIIVIQAHSAFVLVAYQCVCSMKEERTEAKEESKGKRNISISSPGMGEGVTALDCHSLRKVFGDKQV